MTPKQAIETAKNMLEHNGLSNACHRAEDQNVCITEFQHKDGSSKVLYGACFAYLYKITGREDVPYIAFYAKKPIIDEERYRRWIGFCMDYYNQLAGKKLFESTLDDLPYVVVNTDHQYNVIMSALTSVRMVYEQHFYIELWNNLVESGVDEVTAWIFTHLCNVTPVDGGRFWLFMKPDMEYKFYVPEGQDIFHTSLLTANLYKETCIRMYNREYLKGLTPHWDESHGGVNGVHDLFGSSGGISALTFVKGLTAGKGSVSKNPFVKEPANKSKRLSLEETTKFFLSIVEDFEKGFKP